MGGGSLDPAPHRIHVGGNVGRKGDVLRIGRPGIGSKSDHPAAMRSSRSASGSRTMTDSWCTPAVMLPPMNAAGKPNILRTSMPSMPATAAWNRPTSSGGAFGH